MSHLNTKRGFGKIWIIIIIFLVLVVGVYLLLAINWWPKDGSLTFLTSDINTADWKTYRNEKYGFEFKYPPKCKIKDDYNSDWNFLEKSPPYDALLLSLCEYDVEEFFNIVVSPFYKSGYNLEELYENTIYGMKSGVISKTEVSLGVEKGIRVELELLPPSTKVVFLFFHDGIGFKISYGPSKHHIFSNVMSTFQFTK